MFKGTYVHKIDPKGRLPVPAAFRRALAEQGASSVVVTQLDQCLAAYSPSEWARLEGQLAALPAFSRQVKALTRMLTSRAADCDLDVQGRILVPPALRAAAELAKDVAIVGVLNRIEIWNPERWDAFVRDSERLLDDVSLDVQWPLRASADLPVPTPAATSGEGMAKPGHPQRKPNR